MNRKTILLCGFLLTALVGGAQELKMTGSAPLTLVFGESVESDEPLPMNDLGMEFGYVLYEAEVTLPGGDAELELANVRDYAAVYLDGEFRGTMTDSRKTLTLHAEAGSHALQLYVENIGRITYGPEILDNSKGLFGSVRLGGEEVAGWRITPLEVRDADTESLDFGPLGPCNVPCFRRGYFDCAAGNGVYLDVSGWARCGSTAVTWAPSGTRRSSSRSGFRTTFWNRKGTGSSFSTSGTTIRMRRCVFRTNPCSNNQYE